MIRFGAVLWLGVASLIGGCASAPVASEYLDDYGRLVAGEHLERVWISPSYVPGASVGLGEIAPRRVVDMNGVTVENAMEWLRQGLADAGLRDGGRYRLDLVISEMNPGSAAARIWAGEFGAGHAFVQIEGKLIDTSDGAVVATFAERRRASGAAGFRDLGGDSGPAMVEEIIKAIAADIVAEFTDARAEH